MRWTRQAVLLLGALAGLGVAAQWSPWPLLQAGFQALALLALAVLVVDGVRARRWPLQAVAPTAALLPLGRAVPAEVGLVNGSTSTVLVEFRPGLPAGVGADEGLRRQELPPGTSSVRLALRGLALGPARWPGLRVAVRGPLGVAWWSRTLPLAHTFTVVPDGAVSTPGIAAVERDSRRQQLASGRGLDLLQLREYRSGDPLRCIDWKAYARSGQLMVRQYTRDEHREVVLMIDASRRSSQLVDGLSRLGHFANIASRLVSLCARTDDRVGLVAYSADVHLRVPPLPSATGAARLHRAIGGLRSDLQAPAPLAATLELGRLVRRRALVLYLCDLQDAATADQLVTAVTLIAGKHQVVLVDLADAELAATASAAAVDADDVYCAIAARAQVARTAATLQRLTRLGCRAVQVPPADAEAAVTRLYLRLRATSPA